MALERIEFDIQRSVSRRNRIRIVPFKILCCSVPDVDSFEKRIIARIKGAPGLVEFVRELV